MSALNELQNYTFVSKYARWIEKENRRETWKEAVDRVKDMMHTMYADKNIKEDIDWAYDLMFKKKILGSQRCLQFGGEPILKRNSKLYNCTASYCDRLRFFQECFWLLLCGSGTGFSVQKHHVAKLPNLSSEKKDRRKGVKYIIEDSIEGWSDALGVLLSSYFVKPSESKFKEYKDQYIVFDYSKIRPKGSPLTSGVGKAPGFEPLQNGLEKIRELLDGCVANGQKKLRPIDAYDIVMHSSDAVLSGGVRRCIAKGSKVLVKGCSYKNIEDVAVGDMVSTINGWRKVVNTFNQGTQKTLTIQHQDGALQCTPNHRIAVLEYDQSIVWKYAKDLKENDTLCFVKNNNFTPVKSFLPTFSYKAPQNSTTCKNITIPTLDEDIAWLLGEIQGDGYVKLKSNSGEISVACEANAPEKAIKISKQLRRFGVNASIQQPKATDQCYKIRVKSKQLAQYFHGWLKQPKSTLIVPECIKKSDPKIKLAYLQGLLDADGHIGARCQQVVCTIYKEFAKELQSLLYSINIVSRFKTLSNKGYPEHWQQKYGLFLVNNEDRELFNCCQIGYKKFRPALIQKNSNSYSVGHFEYAKSKNLPKYWHQHVASNQKNIPYSTWNKVFGPSNIVPVNVAKIIDDNLTVETFDIEVEDDHNFICEGILVHNSASLALFSANDEEMAKAKTGNWYIDNPQRARSNNSALLLKNDTKYEDFQKLMESVKEFGEPGFIWGDSTEMVFNPCVEISLWPVNEKTGESGWQGCNLSTINCSSIVDENDFYERCKAAALIGTLQAGFTKLTYLGKNSEEIFEREALLGVSMTGIMEKHDLILTEKVLKEGAKIAVDTNKEFSKKIGINQAARVTCLKPEGTSSSMLGTSSGIHPHHAKRYIRHVQANILEPPYQYFKSYNPQACEKSSWSANNTDEVIKFPIEVPDGSKLKNQLPAVEMLAIVKDTQKNWVQSGKNRSLCTQDYLCHNVSNTVTVKPDEWEDVTKYIYNNRKYFAGISLIPQSGDKDYPQAPFTTVLTSREIVKEYGDAALWCSGLIELGLNAFDNNLWAACDYITLSQETDKDGDDKQLFSLKMRRFAKKYFNEDIKRLTYCMKDVYNWKIYTDLYDSFTKVDYTQLLETQDNTVGIEEISCAGGACLI